jgi:hypothetical protein
MQGSDEWREVRKGIATASVMKEIVTPAKLEISKQIDGLADWLAAERMWGSIEDNFVSFDMQRGTIEQQYALDVYNEKFGEVTKQVGFVTNNKLGFTIGCSPDFLRTDRNSGGEIKSMRPDLHLGALLKGIPKDHMLQIQATILVCELEEYEYVQYSNGIPMLVLPVKPDLLTQEAIIRGVTALEALITEKIEAYKKIMGLIPTPKRTHLVEVTDE